MLQLALEDGLENWGRRWGGGDPLVAEGDGGGKKSAAKRKGGGVPTAGVPGRISGGGEGVTGRVEGVGGPLSPELVEQVHGTLAHQVAGVPVAVDEQIVDGSQFYGSAVDLRGDDDEDLTEAMPEPGTYGAIERVPPMVLDGVLAPEGEGSAPIYHGKPDMAALRAICAGEIVKPDSDYSTSYSAPTIEGTPAPTCGTCEKDLQEGKGKLAGRWACVDLACPMYGKVQGAKR